MTYVLKEIKYQLFLISVLFYGIFPIDRKSIIPFTQGISCLDQIYFFLVEG